MPVRIFIVDDHETVRRILRSVIERHAGWQVCGEAGNGREAIEKAAKLVPDLIILDLAMPIMDGIRAAREISSVQPTIPILLHTMHNTGNLALEAKKAGVRKIIVKGDSGGDLLEAMESELREAPHAGAVADAGSPIAQATADAITSMVEKSPDLSTPMRDSDATREPD